MFPLYFHVVSHAEPLLGWIQSLLMDVWGIHAESGLVTLDPLNPAPIVIDPSRDRDYFQWSIEPAGGAFALINDDKNYIANELGESQIWVRTVDDKFQGEFAGGHTILEVKPIEVEIWSPDLPGPPFYLDPGQEIELVAEVRNADDPTVEWFTDGHGSVERLASPSREQCATYTAPREPAAPGQSYNVEAFSITSTGLRESGIPVRNAVADVIVGGLHIMPGAACVEIGDSLPLRVIYSFGQEADFADLEVMVSGSDAGYVAGNVFHGVREGTVIVSVWDRDFPQWADDATFTVQEECEGFSVTMTGDESVSFGGKYESDAGRHPSGGGPCPG